jgi:hypothetical protein
MASDWRGHLLEKTSCPDVFLQEHYLDWYQYFGHNTHASPSNGSVYIVTGVDKARSWSIATFALSSQDYKMMGGYTDGPGLVLILYPLIRMEARQKMKISTSVFSYGEPGLALESLLGLRTFDDPMTRHVICWFFIVPYLSFSDGFTKQTKPFLNPNIYQ